MMYFQSEEIAENPDEITVIVNHAKSETKAKMIENGICYLRAGETDGSLCVTPGLEKYGFTPSHAAYYIVLRFDNSKGLNFKMRNSLKERINTYRAKIRPLSDLADINNE